MKAIIREKILPDEDNRCIIGVDFIPDELLLNHMMEQYNCTQEEINLPVIVRVNNVFNCDMRITITNPEDATLIMWIQQIEEFI